MRWITWLLGKEWDQPLPKGKFSELRPDMLMITLRKLQARIAERFPEAGLGKVSKELTELGRYGIHIYPRLHQPMWALRILTAVSIITLVVVVTVLAWQSVQKLSSRCCPPCDTCIARKLFTAI